LLCKLCGKEVRHIFNSLVLGKYDVSYFQCTFCGFIQTEDPYWLDEAYRSSLNIEDTGIVQRNLLAAKRTNTILYFFLNHHSRFLDFGGGTGLFVRMMRDAGFDFYWNDPYTTNIFARGYEADLSRSDTFEAVTSFECFEHFLDPLAEIRKMLTLAPTIIFSTEIFSGTAPSPDSWRYYHFSHGQHIAFFSLQSLEYLARKYQLHLLTNYKSFHVLKPQKHSSALFQFLVKASVLGIPSLITSLKGSKMKTDAKILADTKNKQ
jgi:hypothetical protein